VSETPAAPGPQDDIDPEPPSQQSFPVRLAYGVYAAMTADMGCIIGAIAFVVIILLSVQFAPQLTPCTSAAGIPCGGH
jgi:hypothetical protein